MTDSNNNDALGSQEYTDDDPALLRLIYAIIFYFVYSLSRFVVAAVAIFQFFHVLFTEELQPDLLKFSGSLTRYAGQLVAYVTWASHQKPFPFSDWPSEENQQVEEA